MKNPLWFIIWLVLLIFLSFFVAAFCAGWYIIIYPITVCIPGLSVSGFVDSRKPLIMTTFYFYFQGITDLLLQGIQFPHYCASGMMECRSLF